MNENRQSTARARISVDRLIRFSPAQPLFQRISARKLSVLAYHDVSCQALFASHLDYIAQNANPVALDDVVHTISTAASLPEHALLITFDDGDRSVYEIAMPMMRDRGIPGIVFVMPGYLNTSTPLWTMEARQLLSNGGRIRDWAELSSQAILTKMKNVENERRLELLDELRASAPAPAPPYPQLTDPELLELEQNGISIGNHTLTHPCLDQCSLASVHYEIEEAHSRLTGILGHEPSAFAYPNGDHDPRAERVLADLGYKAGFLFDHRHCSMPPRNPLLMSRLRVNSDTNMDRFRTIMSGLHPFVHRLRFGR